MEIVLLTFTPMSCAAALSSEQARMALPILVFAVNHMRPTMMMRHAMTVTMETAETLYCAKKPGTGKVTSDVKFLGVAPQMSWAAFCRKYETPMAVMRTASGPASRSGRYASPSITTPSTVQTITESTTDAQPGIPR